MKRTYQRSQILFFFELSPEQQIDARRDDDNADEQMFVLYNNAPISLNMFTRIDKGLFHGHYATSAFDGYLIRINKTQEFATVVHAIF